MINEVYIIKRRCILTVVTEIFLTKLKQWLATARPNWPRCCWSLILIWHTSYLYYLKCCRPHNAKQNFSSYHTAYFWPQTKKLDMNSTFTKDLIFGKIFIQFLPHLPCSNMDAWCLYKITCLAKGPLNNRGNPRSLR